MHHFKDCPDRLAHRVELLPHRSDQHLEYDGMVIALSAHCAANFGTKGEDFELFWTDLDPVNDHIVIWFCFRRAGDAAMFRMRAGS